VRVRAIDCAMSRVERARWREQAQRLRPTCHKNEAKVGAQLCYVLLNKQNVEQGGKGVHKLEGEALDDQ